MLFKNRDQIINNGQTSELKKIREEILEILSFALEAVDPYKSVKKHFYNNSLKLDSKTLDTTSFDNIFLVSFGKASIGMAQAVCDSIDVEEGIIITNNPEKKVECNYVSTIVASHPIPDENSITGADKVLDVVKKCDKNDLLIVLISGGGSALLCKPRVSLVDLQKTTDLLLKCGANINEINTVRKHLSFVKGGQLVKNAKCTVVSLVISDIIGDPLEFIASGPTYPDSTTYNDAENILEKYGILTKVPSSVKDCIKDGISRNLPETPKANDPIFKNVNNIIIANNKIACEAAEAKAEELGYKTMLLTTHLDGEASDIGKYLSDKALNYKTYAKKMAFIAGGETTVTIKGKGKGGRNQEMVLSSVEKLADKDIVFTSFATDGIDGMSDASGAIADSYSKEKAYDLNLDPDGFLEDNNSYEFFKNLEDALITGPTGTNVMDIQLIIKIS